MATTGKSKLNRFYTQTVAGAPVTSEDLANLGVSADLAVHYVRAGWLSRLARGVFVRQGEAPELHPSLRLLERTIPGFHVGGKTALNWYGLRHYVAQQETLHLYGSVAAKLPPWFVERFPAEYHRKRLFTEPADRLLHVAPFEDRVGGPQVSAPERAMLELLSEVGVRQPLQEARELMESAYNLRADVLRELLKRCTNVKTVRLCLQLGREFSLPWIKKLNPAELPTGSERPWVSRSAGSIGTQAMNQIYLDTARLLTQVAPLVFEDGVFALKGGTAINPFAHDMPRLSVATSARSVRLLTALHA